MTVKELFADFGSDYADVFIMDSADMCDAYRGTIYPYNGEISIDFADETPNPAVSYADREIIRCCKCLYLLIFSDYILQAGNVN